MIGKRLKQSRDALGLSLRELDAAIQSQVSAQAIGKYERNEMMPSSKILLALADALKVTPEYLLNNREIELEGVDFRKGMHAGVKELRAVQAVVLDKMERYLEIEEILPGSELIWKKPKDSAFTINAIEDAEKAAKKLRSLWHLGDDPIPFMAELLEEQGIKVISLDLPVDVSGSKAFVKTKQQDEKPIVVVNSKHNAVRQRFTLAHELAHLILDIPNKNILNEEKVADRFAGAFLMVKEAIVKLVGVSRSSFTIGELAELTKIFKVSIASLVVRCGQLNILSKASYGILFGRLIKLGLTGPVSKEPIAFAAEVPQRMERMCLRAVAEHIISESKAAELLQMNIRDFDKLMMVRGV